MNQSDALHSRRRWQWTPALLVCTLLLLATLLPGANALAQGQQIEFAPGATATNVRGVVTTAAPASYLLRADAGQTLHVTANYVNNTYEVVVNAPSGAYLGKAEIGRPWSGLLPAGGDYGLTVSVPPMYTGNVYFSLDISLTGGNSAPTPTPGSGVQRINFATGATSATVAGQVAAGRPAVYLLRASAGQEMTVRGDGPGPFMTILTGADGSFLGSAEANQPLQARLPTTQDYYISLQAPADAPASNFNLSVSVVTPGQPTPAPLPPAPTPTPAPGAQGPQRINFAAGATSATVAGQVSASRPAVYVLRALAGQNMTVRGDGPGPFTVLLTGADGSFLGSTAANTALTVRLPTTQDYYVSLQSTTGAPSNFTLTVSVVTPGRPTPTPGRSTPTPAPQQPQRINFAAGATSATVNGQVAASRPVVYVLRALAGQTLRVIANGPGPFRVSLTGADGSFLGSANANEWIEARLPATQDYYITLQGPADVAASAFTLTVSVVGASRPTPTPAPARPQRINFAPNATSATVNGQVTAGTPVIYVLRALAGQNMRVFASSANPFRITLTGADGSFLASGNANQPVEARLPATQDYYITLEAPIGGAALAPFTLTVSVVGATRPTAQPATQRIQFAAGATSATVSGYTTQRYVLGARTGQTMYVDLSASGPATVVIRSASGQVIGRGDVYAPWSGVLPATQDYTLTVESDSGGVGFSMTVSIY